MLASRYWESMAVALANTEIKRVFAHACGIAFLLCVVHLLAREQLFLPRSGNLGCL